MSRLSRSDLAGAGVLLLLTLAFFKGVLVGHVLVPWDVLRLGPPWGRGGIPHNLLLSDPVRLYAPWRELLAQSLHEGRLPFWDPYVFAGNTFLANTQAAVLYPPNLIYGLLPADVATTAIILFHTFWGGLGAYLLARHSRLRLGIAPALLAGVSFGFCGWAMVWAEFPTFMGTLAWLPWILLALTRLESRVLSPALAGLAVCVAMGALAGHAQVLQYVLLAGGLALLVISLHAVRTSVTAGLRSLVAGGAGIAVGLALAAPQLLATLQAGPLIIRQKEALEGLVGTAFSLQSLPLVALPRVFGDSRYGNWRVGANENEYVAFAGLVCLLLAPLALARIREREVQVLLALEALSWSIALGTPVFQLMYRVIPTISQFRAIRRATAIHSLVVPLLGAVGLQVALDWLGHEGRDWRRGAAYLAVAALAIAGLFLVDREMGRAYLPHDLMLQQYAAIGLVAIALAVGLVMLWRGPKLVQPLALLLPMLAFGEMFIAYGAYNTADPGPSPLHRDTRLTSFLQANAGRWVAFTGEPLTGNTTIAYGVSSVQGSDSFIISNFADVYSMIEAQRADLAGNNAPSLKKAESLDSPLLDILAVRWVITDQPPETLAGSAVVDPTPVLDAGGERVYRRRTALPYIGVYCTDTVSSEEQLLARMADPPSVVRLRSAAQVTGTTPSAAACGANPVSAPGNGVSAVTFGPESAAATVDSSRAQVMVLSENWYPGWEAAVDGKPAPLLRVDHTLMGAEVPAGHHDVSFRFRPTTLLPGLLLTSVALVCLATILGAVAFRSRGNTRASGG